MSSPLRLHWSRSKPNFGDWLSPLLCEALSGRPVEYAPPSRCDLVAVGSLFDRIPRSPFARTLDVWGTGSIEAVRPRRSRHRYHALRGPLTASLLRGEPCTTYGDPGLLVELLVPEHAPAKRYDLGIIPHYKDAGLPAVGRLTSHFPRCTVIDVFEHPPVVIEEIRACHAVLSSSLHGLVAAHGLGIPGVWMELSQAVRGAGWKFRDHYQALNEPEPRSWHLAELLRVTLDQLIRDVSVPDATFLKQGLLASFPFKP